MASKGLIVLNVILLLAVGYLFVSKYSEAEPVAAVASTTPKSEEAPKAMDEAATDSSEVEVPMDTTTRVIPKTAAIVAYFDMDSVNSNSDMVKDLNKELLQSQQKIQARIKRKEEAAVAKQKELEQRASTVTTQEAYQQLQLEFEEYRQKLILEVENLQVSLQKDELAKQDEIGKTIRTFIKNYAKEQGFDFVMAYSDLGGTVSYANLDYDITQAVILGLNKEYKSQKSK